MEPKRYWSDLSDSYKEELKGLWQSSSEDFEDNYKGFSLWLLNNYNIILDSKDNNKKEEKIFFNIMAVMGIIVIGIALAIVIISSNSKDKLIEVLESDSYNCNYDKSICNRIDYPKPNNIGEFIFNFEKHQFLGLMDIYFDDNITTVEIDVVYNWKLDTSTYKIQVYKYNILTSQVNAKINEYGTFTCNGTTYDCNDAKLAMEQIKENFNTYLIRADIDKDKLQ